MSSGSKQGNVRELVQTLLGTFHRARVIEVKYRLVIRIIDEYSTALTQLDSREVSILKLVQPFMSEHEFNHAVLLAMSEFQSARERLTESALTQMETIRQIH